MGPKIRSNQNVAEEDIGKKLSTRVDKLEEFLQSGLRELKNQVTSPGGNDDKGEFLMHLNAFENKVQDTITAIKKEIIAVQEQLDGNEKEIERIKEERTLNSLLLSGVPEKEMEDLYDEVCRVIRTKLKLTLAPSDINYCFRLGKKRGSDKKPRLIVIKFVNRWKRDEVYRVKKNFKGSEYIISEFLSLEKRNLFSKVRAVVGVKNCWTMKGKLFAFINNSKKLITKEDDLPGSK